MKLDGNTILITGGGSGIGRALAEAFHALGNEVVICGRKEEALKETVAANPGMKFRTLDVTRASSVRVFGRRVICDFPALNVLINNAGVMRAENLRGGGDYVEDAEEMVATNLLGPIRLTAALLPLLERQEQAVVLNVSSGLAFVPLAGTPTYSATKAALHSYSESLRFQFRESHLQVVELIPPYVQTTLMGEGQANDPRAMPLEEFIAEAMEILRTQPEATEICVKRVHPLRSAAEGGREKYEQIFQGLNSL